jgi:hypothetical protein
MTLLLASALAGIGAVAASAQTRPSLAPPPIDSDRSNVTLTSRIMTMGDMQIETGLDRLQDGKDQAALHTWATPVRLRMGLPRDVEFRLQSQAFTRVRTFEEAFNGMSDVELGVKGPVNQTSYPDLSMAWLLQTSVPTGSNKLSNGTFHPAVLLPAEWQTSYGYTIAVTPGVRLDGEKGDYYGTAMLAVSAIRQVNDKFTAHVGATAPQIRGASRGGKVAMWDVGASYRALSETQLDAGLSWGVKDNDPDLEWRIGASQRFTPNMPRFMSHKASPKPQAPPTADDSQGH